MIAECGDAPRAQEKFALKVVDRSKANRHKKLDEVVVEKWVLANLSHPSIIRIYQTFQERARPSYLPTYF